MSQPPDQLVLGCDHCRDVVERPDVLHVLRKCTNCGRELRIAEPGEHGRGIKVSKGDTFVMPAGWLKISFNPLKSRGIFSRAGLDWFAKLVFIDGLTRKEATFEEDIAALEQRMDDIVNKSELIEPLDINKPIDIGRPSRAVPVTPPCVRVRTRRFDGVEPSTNGQGG